MCGVSLRMADGIADRWIVVAHDGQLQRRRRNSPLDSAAGAGGDGVGAVGERTSTGGSGTAGRRNDSGRSASDSGGRVSAMSAHPRAVRRQPVLGGHVVGTGGGHLLVLRVRTTPMAELRQMVVQVKLGAMAELHRVVRQVNSAALLVHRLLVQQVRSAAFGGHHFRWRWQVESAALAVPLRWRCRSKQRGSRTCWQSNGRGTAGQSVAAAYAGPRVVPRPRTSVATSVARMFSTPRLRPGFVPRWLRPRLP